MSFTDQLPPRRPFPSERVALARRQLDAVVSRPRRGRWGPMVTVAMVTGTLLGGTLAAAAYLSKGPIPISNGILNLQKAPVFVSVEGHDGKVVGYVPRADLITTSNTPLIGGVLSVFAANLTTVVGHLFPGIGYVPIGVPPTSERCIPASIMTGNTSVSIPCPTTKEVVPNVVGTYMPTAAAAISHVGVALKFVYEYSSTVTKGFVISVSPAPGSTVDARSVVVLTGSKGPGPRTAP